VSELFGPKTLSNSAHRAWQRWRLRGQGAKWWTPDVHGFQILATRYFAGGGVTVPPQSKRIIRIV